MSAINSHHRQGSAFQRASNVADEVAANSSHYEAPSVFPSLTRSQSPWRDRNRIRRLSQWFNESINRLIRAISASICSSPARFRWRTSRAQLMIRLNAAPFHRGRYDRSFSRSFNRAVRYVSFTITTAVHKLCSPLLSWRAVRNKYFGDYHGKEEVKTSDERYDFGE